MKDAWIKIVIGASIVVIIISIVLVISVIEPINLGNDESETIETTKYSFEAKLEDLHLEKKEDYLEYLIEISKKVKPELLKQLVIVDMNIAAVYKNSYFAQKENGEQVLRELTAGAYRELLCRVIRHGEDWSELPLTKHFREKFNPEEGVLNDQYYNYEQGVYLNPGFNYKDRTVVTLCADENGNKYYGWYDFVLNDEGYLDDVIFNHREEIMDDILIDG